MKNKVLTIAALGTGAVVAARTIAAKNRAFDPRGKVILITGASRGMGLELARQLADAGASLAICARDADELERARHELEARGANVFAGVCDVTQKESVQKFVAQVEAHYGAIDALVNNAGIIQIAPVEVMTGEYEEAMNTHYWGALHFIHAVLPQMKSRNSGRIVNIASIGGKICSPHMIPYCASKFALVGLSHGLRAELAKDGIIVITVCPPLVRTGGFYRSVFKGRHKAEFAVGNIANASPLLSISAQQAAQRIIAALKSGVAETMLSKRGQFVTALVALFPGATADILALGNRALPKANGEDSIGTQRASGLESESPLSESPLTVLNQQEFEKNNEAQEFVQTETLDSRTR